MNDITISRRYKELDKETKKYRDLYECNKDILDDLGCKLLFQYKDSSACTGTNFLQFNVAKIIADQSARGALGVGYNVEFYNQNGDINSEVTKKVQEHEKKIQLRQRLMDWYKQSLINGYSVMRARGEGEDLRFNCVPVGYFKPGHRPNLGETIADLDTYYIITEYRENKESYKVIIEYCKQESGKWRIIRSTTRQEFPNDPQFKEDVIIQRSTMNVDVDSEGNQIVDDVDMLPLFILNNDYVCNEVGVADSEFKCMYDQITEIYRIMSMLSLEFINNLESKLSVNEKTAKLLDSIRSKKQKDGLLHLKSNINLLTHSSQGDVARFVQKNGDYLDIAFKWVEMLVAQISSISGIPSTAFGVEDGQGNETATLTKSRNDVFIDKINTKRGLLLPMMENIYSLIAKEVAGYEGDKPVITFDDIIEDKTDANHIFQSVDREMISKETGSKMLFDMNDEQREQERARLGEQLSVEVAIQGGSFDTFT